MKLGTGCGRGNGGGYERFEGRQGGWAFEGRGARRSKLQAVGRFHCFLEFAWNLNKISYRLTAIECNPRSSPTFEEGFFFPLSSSFSLLPANMHMDPQTHVIMLLWLLPLWV